MFLGHEQDFKERYFFSHMAQMVQANIKDEMK